MSKMFKKIVGHAVRAVDEQTVSIPITGAMMQYLLQKKTVDGVTKLYVEIIEGMVKIKGNAKKMLISVPFEILLKPQRSEGRLLHFEIIKFSPANLEIVKKNVFNQPPFVSYEQGVVSFDLNGLDVVKKVPIGNIKSIEIKEDKVWIRFGL